MPFEGGCTAPWSEVVADGAEIPGVLGAEAAYVVVAALDDQLGDADVEQLGEEYFAQNGGACFHSWFCSLVG